MVFEEVLDVPYFRFMYHHQSDYDFPLQLHVVLKNVSDSLQTITLFQGLGGSSSDFVFSGYKSALVFWRDILGGGQLVTLQPNQSYEVVTQGLLPSEAISGLIKFFGHDLKSLSMQVYFSDPDFSYLLPSHFLNLDMTSRVACFRETMVSLRYLYRCQVDIKTIKLGGDPFLKDVHDGFVLQGNYGAFYSISLLLVNPYDYEVAIQLLKGPLGPGGHRGVFVIDGQLVTSGVVNAQNQILMVELLNTFHLNPFESRMVRVFTMPIAGGIYPIELMLRYVKK